MRLTTRQRYATRIMVFLAGHGNSKPVQKREISIAEDIAADYIEQICMRLKSGGLIRSLRGKQGGFVLSRSAEEITVADVLDAVDGKSVLAPCLGERCKRETFCVTMAVWRRADEALRSVFSGVTIAELAGQAKRLAASRTITFEI